MVRTPKLRFSIVSKLALLVFAVAFPLSLILAWSISSQFNNDITVAKQHAVNIVAAIAARTDSTLTQTRTLLQGLAKRPELQAMNRRKCDPFLVDILETLPQYANINVMNRQWEFVCSAVFHNADVVRSTKYPEVYQKMIAIDDMAMSPPIQGQLTGKWVVFGAYPVKNLDNRLLGAVTAPIELIALAPAISGNVLPSNTVIKIIDGDGQIVTSFPDTDRIGQLDRGIAAIAKGNVSGSTVATSFDGVERVYAYAPVHGADWVAFAGLPTASIFADSRHVRNQILLSLFVVLALAAMLAFIMARQIARPILELQKDADILADGHHSHRSKVVSSDEIGQLAVNFNHMAQVLEADEVARERAEISIKQLNRVYALLSQINILIVRVQAIDELFRETCRIATDAGGFSMAMLVSLDRVTKQMVSITSAGKGEQLLTDIKGVLSTKEGMKSSIIWAVVKEKIAVVSNNIQNDSRLIFGKQYAEAGVNSMVVLPLIVSDEVVGILALYASEANFFQQQELKLLTELADDIAYAIDHIDKQDRLNFLAYHDDLTGLANRSLLLERLEQYIHSSADTGHRLAFGLIDLERFRHINDSLGRNSGDLLLNQVASWLLENVTHTNMLARIDADHFAIVLPELKSQENLEEIVKSLMAAFRHHPFQLNNAVFRLAMKFGITVYPDDGDTADTLFSNAEAALKKAKFSGDRYLFFTQNMTENVATKLSVENQLRQAIDNEEFVLHYQPKVDLMSDRVTGAEALIRWNKPGEGLVPPGKFIPVLEETGMIYEVGHWAMRKAIEDLLHWRSAGHNDIRVAVNVSPLQLRNPGFISEVEQLIAIDSGVVSGLELEITESMMMADLVNNIATLQAIRAMGITIAIDDFGTGFSSLNYLAKLPVDTLKIDRSFIIEMATTEGFELVSTITRVAHALKLKVVAEGVETNEQLHQIRSLSCEEMQGFLFSKPVTAEDFETSFLRKKAVG